MRERVRSPSGKRLSEKFGEKLTSVYWSIVRCVVKAYWIASRVGRSVNAFYDRPGTILGSESGTMGRSTDRSGISRVTIDRSVENRARISGTAIGRPYQVQLSGTPIRYSYREHLSGTAIGYTSLHSQSGVRLDDLEVGLELGFELRAPRVELQSLALPVEALLSPPDAVDRHCRKLENAEQHREHVQ